MDLGDKLANIEVIATVIASAALSSEYIVRRLRRVVREEIKRRVRPEALHPEHHADAEPHSS